jgi:3-dehydroquinate dehydratase-2
MRNNSATRSQERAYDPDYAQLHRTNGQSSLFCGKLRAMKHVLVLHGPNLNLLGTREPEVYGRVTLSEINVKLTALAEKSGAKLDHFQSNTEGMLVDRVQQARTDGTEFIIINPAAFTHTSVALRDALAAVAIPFVEVHLSNVFAREAFRKESYFSDIAVGVISGLGATGYELALQFALQHSVRS